jgi:sulfur-carrier protein|tara:strand:+ start:5989 stop:6222 length:234 start_codon:yes stop_codon:yes gene_type:complete
MRITYFGEIADITGKTTEELMIKGETLHEVISYLSSTYNLTSNDFYVAINHKLVAMDKDIHLNENDEVALLSPFAGG